VFINNYSGPDGAYGSPRVGLVPLVNKLKMLKPATMNVITPATTESILRNSLMLLAGLQAFRTTTTHRIKMYTPIITPIVGIMMPSP